MGASVGELCLTGRLESTTDPVVRLRAVERSEAVALVLPRANKREVCTASHISLLIIPCDGK